MSNTKNALERAAELLDVPVDELAPWLMAGEYRPMPKLEYAARGKVSDPVGDAAAILRVHPTDLAHWYDARDDLDARVAAQTAADGRTREVARVEDVEGRQGPARHAPTSSRIAVRWRATSRASSSPPICAT